jgi:hypothetical protein
MHEVMMHCQLGCMPAKKYIVTLNEEERQQLEKASQSNRRSVHEKTCTRILLLADTACSAPDRAGLKDSEIAKRLRCASLTVSQVRKKLWNGVP